MQLYALGLNHHTAPLAVRERLSFEGGLLLPALHDLLDSRAVREAAILSTCNRTELYFAGNEPQQAADWLARFKQIALSDVAPYLYLHPQREAARHVFRVASGLDSMVVGEPQILGQVKSAVREAQAAGSLGALLHRLFQNTFSVAKEVRSNTLIGANIVSMAAASVHMCERIFERVSDQRVLFIGAGEMISLCAAHFAAAQPREMVVANRTLARSEDLVSRFGIEAVALDRVGDILPGFDIVISCTAAPLPIIGLGMVERARRARRHRPVVMVDLAVPRDIEPEIADLDDVFLFCVDDLAQVVASGVESRSQAVSEAERIIDARVERFTSWCAARTSSVQTIRSLRDRAEQARQFEIERAHRLYRKTGSIEQALEGLSRGLVNKLLHSPTHYLHEASEQDEAVVRRVYALDEQAGRKDKKQ